MKVIVLAASMHVFTQMVLTVHPSKHLPYSNTLTLQPHTTVSSTLLRPLTCLPAFAHCVTLMEFPTVLCLPGETLFFNAQLECPTLTSTPSGYSSR